MRTALKVYRLRQMLKRALSVMDHLGNQLNEISPPKRGDEWTFRIFDEVRKEVSEKPTEGVQ